MKPAIVIGSAFTAVVLLAGAFQVLAFGVPWLGDKTTEQQTYAHEITKLVVDADSSDIEVRDGDAGVVRVTRRLKWHSGRPRYSETWEDDVLTIQPLGCDGRGTCDLDYSITVPPGTELDVRTTSGDVGTHGITGVQSVRTKSGDIDVADSAGTLTLEASSGDVGVRASRPSSVTVRTSSGDIEVRLPDGDYAASAEASSGDVAVHVRIDDGSPYRVSAEASSGDVDIDYR